MRFPLKFKSEVGFVTFMHLLSAWVLDEVEVEVEMYSATWERPEILCEQVALTLNWWKAHERISPFVKLPGQSFQLKFNFTSKSCLESCDSPPTWCCVPPSPDGIRCRERGYHGYFSFSIRMPQNRDFSKLNRYSTVSWIEYIWIILISLAKRQC